MPQMVKGVAGYIVKTLLQLLSFVTHCQANDTQRETMKISSLDFQTERHHV